MAAAAVASEGFERNISKQIQLFALDESIYETLQLISFIMACVMLLAALLGVAANSISFYIFTRRSMRHSSVNVLLAGLSMIDLVLLVLAVPVFVLPSLPIWSDGGFRTFQAFMLKFIYPWNMITQTSSILTMLVITVERWLAVCHPLKVVFWTSVGKARVALLSVLCIAVAYNGIRFWEYDIGWRNDTGTAYPVRRLRDFDAQPAYMLFYYTGLYLITHFLVPFTLLLLFNRQTAITIIKMRRRRKKLTRQEQTEQRTTLMMMLIVCVFAGCNTLAFVINLVEASNRDFFRDTRTLVFAFVLNDISNLLVALNSATTAPIYYVFSQKYRRLFRQLFPCIWSERSSVRRTDTIMTNTIGRSRHRRHLISRPTAFNMLDNNQEGEQQTPTRRRLRSAFASASSSSSSRQLLKQMSLPCRPSLPTANVVVLPKVPSAITQAVLVEEREFEFDEDDGVMATLL